MTFHALPISFEPPRLNGLLTWLSTLRAELAAIQRLRERGIDAVSRDRSSSSS